MLPSLFLLVFARSVPAISEWEHSKAEALYQQGYIKEAYETLAKGGMAEEMESPRALLLAGAVLEDRGSQLEAEAFLRLACSYFPKSPKARVQLGDLLFSSRRFSQALKQYDQCIQIDGEQILIRYKAMLCRLITDSLISEDENLWSFSEKHPGFYYARAAQEFHQGRSDMALYYIRAAQQVYPPISNYYFLAPLLKLGWISEGDLRLKSLSWQAAEKDD